MQLDIEIDIVIANCVISLNELNQLHSGQLKLIDNFSQSEVLLKSGNQLIATGTLVKIDSDYAVIVNDVNSINDSDSESESESDFYD